MRTPTFRQLAAYGIYLPTFAVSPKLAKETVYMPSQVAAQVLGNGAHGTPDDRKDRGDESDGTGQVRGERQVRGEG